MAGFANQFEEANLYIFLTGEGSGGKGDGKVPEIGVVCESSRNLRISISKYKFDDRTTAKVTKVFVANIQLNCNITYAIIEYLFLRILFL